VWNWYQVSNDLDLWCDYMTLKTGQVKCRHGNSRSNQASDNRFGTWLGLVMFLGSKIRRQHV